MYLYVEFVNTRLAWEEAQMGFGISSNRRIKKIKLTEEQIKELEPRSTGLQAYGRETFETVNVICLQED